jgi:hypothetical protein
LKPEHKKVRGKVRRHQTDVSDGRKQQQRDTREHSQDHKRSFQHVFLSFADAARQDGSSWN